MESSDEHQHSELRKVSSLDFGYLKDLFNFIQNGVIITDDAGEILYVNSAFSRITGYKRSRLVVQLEKYRLFQPLNRLIHQSAINRA